MKLTDALPQLLGKRICGAVVKEGDRMPRKREEVLRRILGN